MIFGLIGKGLLHAIGISAKKFSFIIHLSVCKVHTHTHLDRSVHLATNLVLLRVMQGTS
jgi:hypothetical protein